MKVKDTTNPDLAQIVYIRNTGIKGYDITAGPATPASHSLPETKLPAVPEYAVTLDGGRSHSMLKKASSARHAKSVKSGDSRSSIGSQNPKAAEDSFDQGRKVSGNLDAVTTSAAPQDVTATVETMDTAKPERVKSGTHGWGWQGGKDRGKDAAAAAEAAAAQLQEAEEQDDTCFDDEASVTGDCSLKTPALANVLRYSLKHLLRVYPSGKRMLNNSNPSPMPSWAVGASLAALNWQLADEPMWINEAFFARQESW